MARRFSLVLVGLGLMTFCAQQHAAPAQAENGGSVPYKVGTATRQVLPGGAYDWRGAPGQSLFEAIWYPAEGGAAAEPQRFGPPGQPTFEAAPATPNAPLAAGATKFPLVMLSHGTGATVQSMAWLATALAARGYVVAGVNHPGNTAMGPYTVQGFTLWWLRARDISVALDDLLADDEFGPHIDKDRIGAAGFSLGGYTVIELAGGITSRTKFDDVCRALTDQTSCKAPPEFSDLLAKAQALAASDPDFARALRGDGASYRDGRIRAVFAMAPALGPAVTADSLAKIKIPLAIVAGAADHILPVEANAKYYADKIPHAELTIFPGAVDHYTFVDECTDAGRASLPQLCVDRPGVDRAQVHDATIDLAAKFFGAHL
jgi:predicted dienelactone hydrolase